MRRRFQWPAAPARSRPCWTVRLGPLREFYKECPGATAGPSAAGDRHRGAPPQAERLGRALLRPGDLDDAEGIHQGEKLAGADVAVGPAQRQDVEIGRAHV